MRTLYFATGFAIVALATFAFIMRRRSKFVAPQGSSEVKGGEIVPDVAPQGLFGIPVVSIFASLTGFSGVASAFNGISTALIGCIPALLQAFNTPLGAFIVAGLLGMGVGFEHGEVHERSQIHQEYIDAANKGADKQIEKIRKSAAEELARAIQKDKAEYAALADKLRGKKR
jgi:hypothetical protein